ncbi:hypothetical protein [Mycobacterium sp. shizuoka-1]|uniref:hypothetical protein n=1 Tax=Mycobacterium sp. shizuoka-1 TaxID=2039281 RepID=UPI00115A983A|nr:hypothetical protein [Mycobacterium sp. shizuoka-1]
MGIGRGKTEHAGAHNSSAGHGYWGTNDEAKRFATPARRRDERKLIREELSQWSADQEDADDMDSTSDD